MQSDSAGNTAVGAILGAAVGGAAGAIIGNYMDEQAAEMERDLEGAKIEDRACTCIQVVHPVPRRNFLFHIARIYVDDELNIPIRYEAHDWPRGKDGRPELIEEYTYLDFTPNDKLNDSDFDVRNPNYNFGSK